MATKKSLLSLSLGLLVNIFITQTASAANVDLREIIIGGYFESANNLSGLNCYHYDKEQKNNQDNSFRLGYYEIQKELKELLSEKNISVSSNANYAVNLYFTHKSCANSGKEESRLYLFGLFSKEDRESYADLRVISEIYNKSTGEVISTAEISAFAPLTQKSRGIHLFRFGLKKSYVTERDMWNSVKLKIINHIKKSIK